MVKQLIFLMIASAAAVTMSLPAREAVVWQSVGTASLRDQTALAVSGHTDAVGARTLRKPLFILAAVISPPNDVLCTSNVVTDYGADPTGTTDSTVAFQQAVNATPVPMTSAQPGNIVCVPPGVYAIGSPTPPSVGATRPPLDITILPPASSSGGALIRP